MAKKWMNHLGQEVPTAYVPKLDKQKERVAQRYLKKAKKLNEQLAKFKQSLFEDCDDIYEQMKNDADIRTGKKGYYSVTSFDKSIKIEINIQERIEFDDRINLAQEKINEFISERSSGIDADLNQLINHAFTTRKGRLDTGRILGLFKLKIKAKKWLEAMELIKQSIDRNVTKRYCRIWERNEEGEYEAIDLNFSSI